MLVILANTFESLGRAAASVTGGGRLVQGSFSLISMRTSTHFNLLLLPVLTAVVVVAACSSTGANGGQPAPATTVAEQSGSSNQNPSEDPGSAIERYAKLLEANPGDTNAKHALKQLIDSSNPVSDEQSQRIREILRQHARVEKVSLVNKDEPGERVTVTGTVRNTAGQPVAAR